MTITGTMLHASMCLTYYSVITQDPQLQAQMEVVNAVALAFGEVGYIKYSALRAFVIMEEVYPSYIATVRKCVSVASFLLLTPIIPSILAALPILINKQVLFRAQSLTAILSGIILIAMDALFVQTIVKYVYQNKRDLMDAGLSTKDGAVLIDSRFMIIVRYGVAAVGLSLVVLVISLLYMMQQKLYWRSIGFCVLNLIGLSLFLMKVSLHKVKLKKERRGSVITGNILPEQGSIRKGNSEGVTSVVEVNGIRRSTAYYE
ncbi:UNVERIFIED_CONTAM: hypothetical protein HDU68_001020 [Siphonaria sp. JEL0065]|nr:hypothetical protein HDU68_001020 [Siphonaria sp. JEL0065]